MKIYPENIHLESESLTTFFVGRQNELDILSQHFLNGGRAASISGIAGSGKTALAKMLADRLRNQSSSMQIQCLSTTSFSFFSFLDTHMRAQDVEPTSKLRSRILYVLDDFDHPVEPVRQRLCDLLRMRPDISLLIVGREANRLELEGVRVQISGLTQAEFADLMKRRLGAVDNQEVARLFMIAEGSPLFAEVASRSVRDGILTLNAMLRGLRDFTYPGILGSDGKPVTTGIIAPQIRISVSTVNDAIFAQLQKHPSDMRLLSPRKFEELIAELLARQGYDVELTPISGDGGFDIYVAKQDGLGKFLFLVECKRYTPPTKVGVEIVRALHGVVQQRQANAGIVVTSSFFTRGAEEFQRSVPHKMHLQDYLAVQKWLGII